MKVEWMAFVRDMKDIMAVHKIKKVDTVSAQLINYRGLMDYCETDSLTMRKLSSKSNMWGIFITSVNIDTKGVEFMVAKGLQLHTAYLYNELNYCINSNDSHCADKFTNFKNMANAFRTSPHVARTCASLKMSS